MMQQVNLYLEELQPKRAQLSAQQIVLVLVGVVLLMVVISLFQQQQLSGLEKQLAFWQTQQSQQEEQLADLEDQVSQLVPDGRLVAQKKRLRHRVKQREELLKVIGQQDSGVNPLGFSALMTGLARQQLDGVWLTRIKFFEGGDYMSLDGTAVDAAKIPQFLQNLRQEKRFIGRGFDLFTLEEDEDYRQRMNFKLRSRMVAEEGES